MKQITATEPRPAYPGPEPGWRGKMLQFFVLVILLSLVFLVFMLPEK